MKKIITLGTQLTYSDLAAQKLNQTLQLNADIFFEPTIDASFKALKDADYLVLPIENAIDGYIQRTLDLLYKHDYFMTQVTELPIDFSLISNEQSLTDIHKIYVQFKAKNQCLDFLEQLSHVSFITTDSNTESLKLYQSNPKHTAAIIPKHLIDKDYLLTIHNIHDQMLNHTRFAFIEKEHKIPTTNQAIKAMISIRPKVDKVGLLYDLLGYFKDLNINLVSIISRPRMEPKSPYHFFLEIVSQTNQLNQLLKQIENDNEFNIKILGVY